MAMGGYVYHVLNRGVGRMTLFEDDEDYAAFERVMLRTFERFPIRVLSYCLMPNHWHMLVWPRKDDELSQFMRLLTVTHTQRWHAHHHSAGTGPVYQGRYKSFPVQSDEHFLTAARYVERNAQRAKLVKRAEQWRWCRLHARRDRGSQMKPLLAKWPVDRPRNWVQRVNRPESEAELAALRMSGERGRPFGGERWVQRTAAALSLETTLRPRGRPRKKK